LSIYLLINLLVVVIPLAFSFDRKVHFYRRWKFFFPAMIITAFLFLIWDILFTINGIWGFSSEHLIGIFILHLPIEEWLFFITVPYACVFTYDVLNSWFPIDPKLRTQQIISLLLSIVLFTLAFLFRDRWYTLITFLLTGSFITIAEWFFKWQKLMLAYRAYLVSLLPFLLTNGILTGTFLESPVVWYNNLENMNLRIGTIPLEDTIYGFLLVLLNIFIYEQFQTWDHRKH